MLANSYKTAAELGISEVEVQALVKVLGMLERGEIDDSHFTMKRFMDSCGTVGCICGWAHSISSGAAFPEIALAPGVWSSIKISRRLPTATKTLFAIIDDNMSVALGERVHDEARNRHAALALRSYLTTGSANWDEALRDA